MGRPSDYSPELALSICERLVDGESLRSICESDQMPNRSTIFRWLEVNESFRDQYTRARDMQADTLADELIDIADNSTNDWVDRATRDGTERMLDAEAINRSRLRVDTRKWIASKLKPKKYGDKIEQTHRGSMNVSISETDAEL